MNKLFDTIFLLAVKNREKIITLFKILYCFLIFLTLVASLLLYVGNPLGFKFYSVAKDFGEWGILVYVLTVIPGIFRRFGWKHKLVSILMIFRRYIGVTMFFLILYHYMMMRGVMTLKTGKIFPLLVFELFGVAAFLGLFFLAVTSNDVSTNKLGIWWNRIHMLTYAVLWCIFLHVALQNALSVWSLLLGTAGLFQVLSFVYKHVKNSKS